MTTRRLWHWLFGLALAAPALWLGAEIYQEIQAPGTRFGADPGEAVTDFLGEWAMRALLLALLVSPLRRLSGMAALAPLRRTAGLFAFGYVLLHLLGYLGLLAGFDGKQIFADLTERTYIIAGLVAVLCLTPLALTSTRGWQRRLRRRWVSLHRLVFVAAFAALLHLFWLTRDGYGEPLIYAALFAIALTERLLYWRRQRQPAEPVPAR